ncbi:DddA-like double-stranded DNA deaminase toxin [Amycolatopsis sp. NPDC047767]|uniref:DddA-like double-stranded DNA deaminase toxin n=1 Tax=Amycolatopsis sp. NPDC047767 TaxID=3156765 RepID=UPI0034523F91
MTSIKSRCTTCSRNGMGQTVIGSHVETNLAVHMRQVDIRLVTVVVNHQPHDGPFGCDTRDPRILRRPHLDRVGSRDSRGAGDHPRQGRGRPGRGRPPT